MLSFWYLFFIRAVPLKRTTTITTRWQVYLVLWLVLRICKCLLKSLQGHFKSSDSISGIDSTDRLIMHLGVVLAKCSNKHRVCGTVRDIRLKYIDQR